jgi:iron complex outermembrane receptor protein
MLTKRNFFASTAVIALFAMQGVAHAQTAAAPADAATSEDDKGGIADIVVTATRQSTNLQDTPIAITAITSEALESRGIQNIGDLTSTVPNAQFRKAQGVWGSGVSAFIRGLGSTDTGLAGQSPVAFYIDDVYYPLLLGANFDLLDMEHVEVLRGPQGTLFGRNSLGGAINIVAKQPNTREASGYVEGTVGSYNRLDARAGFNLPLSSNTALMVSVMSKKTEGYQRILDFTCEMNRRGTPALAGKFPTTTPLQQATTSMSVDDCTIGRNGGTDVRGGRAAFLWQIAPSVKLTITGDYLRDLSGNTADTVIHEDTAIMTKNVQSINLLKSQAAYWGLQVDERFVTGDPFSTYGTYSDKIPACTVIPGNIYYNGAVNERGQCTRGGYVLPRNIDLKNWGVAGKLNWDLSSDIALTAVLAYRDLHEFHQYDTDGTPLASEHTYLDLHEPYTNAELRLSGQMDWIDWVAGVFYFYSPAEQRATLIQPVSSGQQRTLHTYYTTNSKAVYANVTVRPFGEKLGITLGGRYADEVMHINFSNVADTSWLNSGSDIKFLQDLNSNKFSWKLGLSYQATNNMLFYASAATGYTLPGYNSRPQQKTQIYQSDPASDVAYEIGAKLDLFDRRVRWNVAAFYTDFSNRPTTIAGGAEPLLDVNGNPVVGNQKLEPLVGGPAGSTQCAVATVPANTGIVCSARSWFINQPAVIKGFESELTVEPIDGLLINSSVGWSKFTAPDIDTRAVNKRQQNPFWTLSGGVQYKIESDAIGGSITPRLDMTWESRQTSGSATTVTYNYLLPAKALFNARLTYVNTEHGFEVAAGIVNLFDKRYWVNIFDYSGGGTGTLPQTNGQPGMPRTWSLTVSKHF